MHLTKKILDHFIEYEEKQTLYLKGEWGIGKTYFWKDYIAKRNSILENYYSYVSLFGAKCIEDVKGAIVVNAIKNGDKNKLGRLSNRFRKPAINISKIVKDLPVVSSYGGKAITTLEQAIINKAIDNYLICFDDLERRAENLSIGEVLGLASLLKEEKECRIIFILNEDAIAEKDREALQSYKEKVVDTEIEFNPIVAENYNHIFSPNDDFYELILSKIQLLDLRNIRILKRIKRNINYFMKLIRNYERSLQEEFINHVVIISYVHASPDCKITTEFLKTFNPYIASFRAMQDPKKADPETEKKNSLLTTFGYVYNDYDEYIIDFVVKGIFDEAQFSKVFSELNQREKDSQIRLKLRKVWSIYHGSFKGTQNEFISSMLAFLEQYSTQLNLKEYHEIEGFLKELGEDVSRFKEGVIRANLDGLSLTDLETLLHDDYVPHEFNHEIEARIKSNKEDFQISKIFEKIANEHAWGGRDTEFLAACSVDDFYDWIITEDDGHIVRYVRQGLEFNRIRSNEPEDLQVYRRIGKNIEQALKKVAVRSKFDEFRVKNLFNISIEDSEVLEQPTKKSSKKP